MKNKGIILLCVLSVVIFTMNAKEIISISTITPIINSPKKHFSLPDLAKGVFEAFRTNDVEKIIHFLPKPGTEITFRNNRNEMQTFLMNEEAYEEFSKGLSRSFNYVRSQLNERGITQENIKLRDFILLYDRHANYERFDLYIEVGDSYDLHAGVKSYRIRFEDCFKIDGTENSFFIENIKFGGDWIDMISGCN